MLGLKVTLDKFVTKVPINMWRPMLACPPCIPQYLGSTQHFSSCPYSKALPPRGRASASLPQPDPNTSQPFGYASALAGSSSLALLMVCSGQPAMFSLILCSACFLPRIYNTSLLHTSGVVIH